MIGQPPAEERLRAAKTARLFGRIGLAAFIVVGVAGVVVVATQPGLWWVVLIAFAACAFLAVRTVQRLRAVSRALPAIEAEVRHQPRTSAATPDGR